MSQNFMLPLATQPASVTLPYATTISGRIMAYSQTQSTPTAAIVALDYLAGAVVVDASEIAAIIVSGAPYHV